MLNYIYRALSVIAETLRDILQEIRAMSDSQAQMQAQLDAMGTELQNADSVQARMLTFVQGLAAQAAAAAGAATAAGATAAQVAQMTAFVTHLQNNDAAIAAMIVQPTSAGDPPVVTTDPAPADTATGGTGGTTTGTGV